MFLFQHDDVLHVLCVGEHIDGLHFNYFIFSVKELQVACL